jgi:Holliday junction resolvase
MVRMPKRVDANQKEIVQTLRECGASVLILSEVGKGCPDICVGLHGKNFLVEIKDGKQPPSKQKLTEAELEFFQNWKGQVQVIKSVEEVLRFMKYMQ